jgi:hypothetical protein
LAALDRSSNGGEKRLDRAIVLFNSARTTRVKIRSRLPRSDRTLILHDMKSS